MKINIEGCVNTLSMECMAFYHDYGKDGRNYTARAVYPCYYDPHNPGRPLYGQDIKCPTSGVNLSCSRFRLCGDCVQP